MSLTIFSWLLALSSVVTMSLSLYALGRRTVTGAVPFAFTLFGECIWATGYWFELNAPDLGGKLFFDNVQFLGTDIGVAGGLLFALTYIGRESWVRRGGPLLAVIPAITFLLVWTNQHHGLVRSDPRLIAVGNLTFLDYVYGPWFWIFSGYNYLISLLGLGLLIAFAISSRAYRQPALAFVVGFSAPALGGLLTLFGLVPVRGLERLDISAITFVFTIPLMGWALFRKRLLDIVPIARTLLVDQMRDAVLVLDRQRRVVDLNRQAGQLLSWDDARVIGGSIGELLPDLDGLIAAAGESGRAELDLAAQPLRDIEASVSVLRAGRGRQIGWLVVLRDISAQKQQSRFQRTLAGCSQLLLRAGQQPAEYEQALAEVLDLLGQAVRVGRVELLRRPPEDAGCICPLAPQGEFTAWARPVDGLERGEIMSGPVSALFAGEPGLASRLSDAGVASLLIMPLFDGQGRWGLLRASSARADQIWDTPTVEFLHAAADMIAVSLRQWAAAEALVQARDAAEAANRAKGAFLAMMSHELRTPLTSILGYSQLMEYLLAGSGNESAEIYLGRITTAGQHLLALINNMLDYSRLEAGRLPVEAVPVQVDELVHAIASAARGLAAQNQNRLMVVCPSDLPILHIDAGRVRQVLMHLLDNAAKFTHAGTITLHVSLEQVGGVPWVIFQVADTGIGIDAEQMHRLFLPFSQIDDALNRKYGGTGLGLALCRRICHLLGGDIGVESQPGQGATFTVRLPARATGPAQ